MSVGTTETVEKKKVGYTRIFALNDASKAPIVVNVGGSGSSKTHSIAQLIIKKLVTENKKKIGVCRKTFPALRVTAMDQILTLLKEYGIYQETGHNKTANIYTHKWPNGDGTFIENSIFFFSIDEVSRIKSLNLNYVWVEEADELSWDEFYMLTLRMRAPIAKGETNQMFLSLNPTDAHGYVPKMLCGDKFPAQVSKGLREDVDVIHSTYMDNPYLSQAYIQQLKESMMYDENSYRVYTLGEWGSLDHIIYKNYRVIPELPNLDGSKWCYGIDFGFVHPSAIVKVYMVGQNVYWEEKLYKSGLTNSDLIEFLSHEQRGEIYGDPSSKMMVEEVAKAGYQAYLGHKGVKESIDLCQRSTILIPASSVNLIKEIRGYQWKVNKDGTVLDEPVKVHDDAVDAARYAHYGLVSRFGFPTQRPNSYEPIKTLHFGRRVYA
jgi:phage terminase large subunit